MREWRICLGTIGQGQHQRSGMNKTGGYLNQRARRKLDIYALITPYLRNHVYHIIYQLIRFTGQGYEQFDLFLHQAKSIVVKVYQADHGLICQPLLANLPSLS